MVLALSTFKHLTKKDLGDFVHFLLFRNIMASRLKCFNHAMKLQFQVLLHCCDIYIVADLNAFHATILTRQV